MLRQSSFGMNSSVMNNKNHVLVACGKCCSNEQVMIPVAGASGVTRNASSGRRVSVQCFTPRNATGSVSLVNTASTTSKKITTDQNLSLVPANAIIDKIEFFGINGFATKGNFSIGLGQLNNSIMTPLIENTTSVIANERVGGCREFASNAADGRNTKTLVLLQSNVNIVLENPITTGNLHVVIEYHIKPTSV